MEIVRNGSFDPLAVLTPREPIPTLTRHTVGSTIPSLAGSTSNYNTERGIWAFGVARFSTSQSSFTRARARTSRKDASFQL